MGQRTVDKICGCAVSGNLIRYCPVHAAAFELLDACNATDIYFRSLSEQWAENDGRRAAGVGAVVKGTPWIMHLAEIAGEKVMRVLFKLTLPS